jgi:cytochrome c-type biogenesis protein CcmE
MDPGNKRVLRLSVALTVALLLAAALVYTSFVEGRDEVTASQLLMRAYPGKSFVLAGTVMDGSVHRRGGELAFRVRDPKFDVSVLVRYTGEVPDAFGAGRGVLVDVHEGSGAGFVGEPDSLTTKCPSKYQAVRSSY